MFGIIRKRKPIILAQWYVSLLDFTSDTNAYYTAIEEDLRARKVPDMTSERMLWKQAGWLSAHHEYLRFHRELMVFDICSAAFGTGWWFSCRVAVLPRMLRVWELLLTVLSLGSFYVSYCQLFGAFTGSIVFASSILFLLIVFYAARETAGLDEFLLYLPVLGALYDAYFRPETYHRQDTRMIYADVVNTIVRMKTKDFCLAGGVTKPDFKEVTKPQQFWSKEDLERFLGDEAKNL